MTNREISALNAALYASLGDTDLPLLIHLFGVELLLKLVGAAGGSTITIPTWEQISGSIRTASAAIDCLENGTAIEEALGKHRVGYDELVPVIKALLDHQREIASLNRIDDIIQTHLHGKGPDRNL